MQKEEIEITESARISIKLANGKYISLRVEGDMKTIGFVSNDGGIQIKPEAGNAIYITIEE